MYTKLYGGSAKIKSNNLSHLFKNSIKGKPLIKKDLTINGLKKVILKLKI